MKIISLLLIITAFGSCYYRDPEKTSLKGTSLPSFDLLLLDSVTHFNTKDIPAGKPVVLFYFSPRCPYCRTEMNEIVENISSLKHIQFYLFSSWPFQEIKNFYKHYQLGKFSNITVGIDNTNFFKDYFEVPGVPYMAIYGKDRKLKNAFAGKLYSKQIRSLAEN